MDFPYKQKTFGDNGGCGVRLIKYGDLVILYYGHDQLDHVYIKQRSILQNKFGQFWHHQFIGKPFGSKIYNKTNDAYIYVLEPTPELWSVSLNVIILYIYIYLFI
jgi:tRNA (adenine57-N1/adenine58-N1)-methyltransferase